MALSNGNLQRLMEQHWLHCRHLESERAWFMKVYVIITGGVLAFISDQGKFISPLLLHLIMIFTLFGFFLTIRWIHAFEYHRNTVNLLIETIFKDYNPPGEDKDFLNMNIPAMNLPVFRKVFKTKYLFPLFYVFALILFSLFAVHQNQMHWAVFIALMAIIIFLLVGFKRSLGEI